MTQLHGGGSATATPNSLLLPCDNLRPVLAATKEAPLVEPDNPRFDTQASRLGTTEPARGAVFQGTLVSRASPPASFVSAQA